MHLYGENKLKKTQITIAVVTSLLILGGCSNLDIPTTSGGDSTASQTTQTTATTAPEKKLTTEEVKILQNYGNKIFNGVKVNGIDVGGMTKDEAMEKLTTELVDPLADRYVLFKYNGLDDYMSYNRLEVKLDPETVNEAMKAGKSTDNFKMLEYAKTSYPASIKAKLSYDKDHLNRVVEDVRKFVLNTSMAKAAEMVDGHVVLKKDAKADKLDVKKLTDALVAAIDFNPEDNERIDAVIEKVPAPVTQADLDVINSKISSFTTDYSWSPSGRYHNIGLAASILNGSLVMPGQVFSFNTTLGPTTADRGYKDAGVYVGDKLEQEPGGGVCQVSSTLYNALIYAGITPTEREEHGMVVGYLPYGMDSVVYDPYLDLKFVNPFDTPIFITAYGSDGDLNFSIYGKEGVMGGYTYEFRQDVYEKIPAKVVTKEDPNLPRGYKKQLTSAYTGYKVNVYRSTYLNGSFVKEELYTENEYRKVDDEFVVGTGDPATTTVPKEDN